MAEKNNYYGWLELPVERFESDPAVLAPIVEKKITEWSSHKSATLQNRAQIHGDSIRAAINNTSEWEKYYLDYKESVTEKILSQFGFVADNNTLTEADVAKIASGNNVGTDYAKKIAQANGYSIGNGGTTKKKSNVTFKLEDMKPKSELKLKPIQDKITDLGFTNLMELLASPDFLGITVTPTSDNDKINEALTQLKNKWAKVAATGPKATQKSHIDKIYSGFTSFLKANPFNEYIVYLKYLDVRNVLAGVQTTLKDTGISELNEKPFNDCVNQIFEVVEDRDKSRSILIGFCDDKGIGYPVERAKIASCPFCSNSFERTEPIQDNCPVCMKPFKIVCPKCKSPRHLLMDTECDGINLQIYPLLEKKLNAVSESCTRLNFAEARSRLNELNSLWPGYPGAADAGSKIQSLESTYSGDIAKIAKHCDNKEYFSAKVIIERINGSFPGFSNSYSTVFNEISVAESALADALRESDTGKRVSMLLEINASIADFSKLNAELKKYPIEPVEELTASVDSNSGTVTLNWKSANKPNSVFYTIRRKQGTPVSNIADGEELATTQSNSYSDNTLGEGQAYYYAVYAYRGPLQSALKVLAEPQVIIKTPEIQITPKDCSIDLSWKPCNEQMVVYYSDKAISKYDEGTKVSSVSASGVLIESLTNGAHYQVAAYKTINIGGKEYRSALFVSQFITPIKPLEPPVFSKGMGTKAGEYTLKYENDTSEYDIVFYYSESLVGISENSVMSLSDMERKAKKLNVTKGAAGSYTVDMGNVKEMFIYPAINVSNTLTVGNTLQLTYIDPITVKPSLSGSLLCLSIDKWPDKADQIIICYNHDVFPQDITDCDRANKIVVSKAMFDTRHLLEIQNVKLADYYITLFARRGRENIPVNTTLFRNKLAVTIKYSVSVAMLTGKVKVTLKNEGGYRPPVTFAIGMGAIPLKPENAVYTFEIPENTSAPDVENITIPNYKVKPNSYVKMFTSASGYRMIIEGNTKLK